MKKGLYLAQVAERGRRHGYVSIEHVFTKGIIFPKVKVHDLNQPMPICIDVLRAARDIKQPIIMIIMLQ